MALNYGDQYKFSVYRAQLKGEKLARLQEQVEYFNKKNETENQKLIGLNKQIEALETELEMKRLQQAEKSKKKDEDPETLKRKNKALQMKLDGLRQKQNMIEAENRKLKDDINVLRRERNLFNDIYGKLKNQLIEKKDDLRRVISESNYARQYIEKAQHELNLQQKQAILEQARFEKEFLMSKPQSQTDNKVFLQHSQLVKQYKIAKKKDLQDGQDLDKIFFTEQSRNAVSGERAKTGTIEQPAFLSKQMLKERRQKILDEEKQLKNLQSQVKEYEQVVQDLLKTTGSSNIEEVVQAFAQQEEENYIIFKNVNQLEDEYEELNRRKKELQQEILNIQSRPKQEVDSKTQKMLKAIEEINEAQQRKVRLQEKVNQQIQIWNNLQNDIPEIYQKLNKIYYSTTSQHYEGFDFTDGITIQNVSKVMSHLETLTQLIIEQHLQQQSSRTNTERRGGKVVEGSNISSANLISQTNDDLNRALDRLEEEFHQNIDKAKDDRKFTKEIYPDNKDKFIAYEDFKTQAEKEFKKLGNNKKNQYKNKINQR